VLIPAAELSRYWLLTPPVVVHIGAHEAEEFDEYRRLGWGVDGTVWVEALPEKAETVRQRVSAGSNQTVLNLVLWDTTGETITFHEASNGQSSSALAMKEHSDLYPQITVTRDREFTTSRLEDALDLDALGAIGLVNLDIQGAELRALEGFGRHIDNVSAVYSEVNLREIYEGCAMLPELDEWLGARGFTRVDWEFLDDGWGDALWLRTNAIPTGRGIGRESRKRDEKYRNWYNRHPIVGRVFPRPR